VVPDDIIQLVCKWLVERRHTDPNWVPLDVIREGMGELRLAKHYCHLTQIACKITGKDPPRLTRDEETILKKMFDHLQAPFQRHKSEGRANFFSYP